MSDPYTTFLRQQNSDLRERNRNLWTANDDLVRRLESLEFDAKRIAAEIDAIKADLGYYDRIQEDQALRVQYEDFTRTNLFNHREE